MAIRYWVGGDGTWDATSTLNWAASSGGAGGQSAPTSIDDVVFDANSGTGITVTCSSAVCATLTATTFNGTFNGTLTIHGGVTSGANVSWGPFAPGLTVTLVGTGSYTISSATPFAILTVNSAGGTYSLAAILSVTTFTLQSGNFSTSNYDVFAGSFSVTGTATSSLTLGSSYVDTSAVTFSAGNNFTFTAGTSLIGPSAPTTNLTINTRNSDSATRGFYDVTASSSLILYGLNTFRNATSGFNVTIYDNQTVTGVLTLNQGTLTTRRAMMGDIVNGVRKTLTVAAFSATPLYWDFSDIALAGAVGTLTGSYLGDRGNNSGITFPSPKTVYWVGGTGSWFNATSWALTSGGAASINNVPLAQDTVVVDNNSGGAGTAISGLSATDSRSTTFVTAIDMSTRSTTVSISGYSVNQGIYLQGNLTLGYSGCTANNLQFYGRAPQTITSNGGTLGGPIAISSMASTVTLADACTITGSGTNPGELVLVNGTLDTNNYNLTISGPNSSIPCIFAFASSSTTVVPRPIFTFALGTSTVSMNRNFTCSGRALQFTGTSTGKLQFTGSNVKTFAAGGAGVAFPTVNQAGAGTLTFTGSVRYYNLTNSYKSTGATTIRFTGGTANTFTLFDLAGEAGRLCTLTSTTTASRALLAFANNTPINAGSTSTDAGNNFGVLFTGGSNGYLSVSYINSTTGQSGFFLM
jgi:hypothetical protein